MPAGTLLYAQSGGVTAVINATASAVIQAARARKVRVLAVRNGILGALREELVDTSALSPAQVRALAHTPGGAFGSCRLKLGSLDADRAKYERLLAVFKAHDVRWFLYNGGNDSADTALKVSRLAQEFAASGKGAPLTCVGVPKTIDNDLADTAVTFGFDTAVSFATECIERLHTTAASHRRIIVVEVMGRYAGWIALNAGVSADAHAILIPEIPFEMPKVAAAMRAREADGKYYSIVVVAEGARPDELKQCLERVIAGDYEFGETRIDYPGASIGVTFAEPDEYTEVLLARADAAMYKVKRARREHRST